MKARYLIAFVALGVALGLAWDAWAVEQSPTVVQLQFREFRIAVAPGDAGSVYSVTDKKGKILADRVTAKELQAKLPEVHRFVRDAFAGDRQTYIDASITTN